MCLIKRILVFSVCLFIMAAFCGCAVPNPNLDNGKAGHVYYPKLQPGATFDTARKELADVLGGGHGPLGIKYYGRPGINDYARNNELAELMMGSTQFHRYYSQNELTYCLFKSIPVLDDGIQISPRLFIVFYDLIERPITVGKNSLDYPYVVHPGLVSFHFKKLTVAQKFADALYSIQKLNMEVENEQAKRLAEFESLAAQYRALAIKPPVSEEQRRLIVQANALNLRKDYAGAADQYLKAVDLDPVSYPGAYFNMALLSAQLQRYNKAIAYMKQYLMLVPDAPDARSAQDKIYEWEFLMQRKQ